MKQFTYEEYVQAYGIKEKIVKCPECKGMGKTILFHDDCFFCNGTGKKNYTKEEYEKRKEDDLKKYNLLKGIPNET